MAVVLLVIVENVIGPLGFAAFYGFPFDDDLTISKRKSLRTCVCRSQPALTRAGVMNFEQISRSLSDFLLIVMGADSAVGTDVSAAKQRP